MNKRALTGIKPTGTPHIGNYLGMIRPALELAEQYDALYFIADYHALTSLHDKALLQRYVYEVAATWLALGLDPERVIFYRQSDVPEIFELTWILDCFTPKGLLNRAHAYKAMTDQNKLENRADDEDVNAGLFNYPVLMAADILLFDTHIVPVGQDQKQHLEITRDIATTFNHTYGNALRLPEARIQADVKTITGLDGRKMSKSYNNTIPLFAPSQQLRKQVMQIVTDSKRPEDPKNPDECNIFNIYKHFASEQDVNTVRQHYLNGGVAYGEMKQTLFHLLENTFGDAREKYNYLIEDHAQIAEILEQGSAKARALGQPILQEVREKIGIGRSIRDVILT
ncbi:MAG: tryptophan--tRNA ligase [Aggregatilineales bacterium]